MKLKMFGLAAAAAVSLSLLTGCPAEEKKETTTTTTTTTTEGASPVASADAAASPAASADAGHGTTAVSPAASSAATAAPAAGASAPAATQQAAAAGDGAAVFSKNNCAACHGAKGEGAVGPNLQNVEAKGDAHIRTTIENGKGAMPAFKDQIKGAELDALVAYVKSL
jgi:mono/diheme cytochrome c family protein